MALQQVQHRQAAQFSQTARQLPSLVIAARIQFTTRHRHRHQHPIRPTGQLRRLLPQLIQKTSQRARQVERTVVFEIIDQLHHLIRLPQCLARQHKRACVPGTLCAAVRIRLLPSRGRTAMQADRRRNTRQTAAARLAKPLLRSFTAEFTRCRKQPTEHAT